MKAQTFILAVIIFLLTISFLQGNSEAALNIERQSQSLQINSDLTLKGDYTYERVFKNGVWWIYVYDGEILIEFYPE